MTEIQTTHYSRYHVRPGRWQALRHAVTGKGFELDGSRVRRLGDGSGGGGAYAGQFRVPDGETSVTISVHPGGTGASYSVTSRNGEQTIAGGGGNGGTGTPGAAGSGAGSEPARGGPGRHRRQAVRRICCETLDGQPHKDCPVYTPGGYARPMDGGLQRICCETYPGTDHYATCLLTPGQRAALADHEALSRPYEERLEIRPSGQPWHCASCGAGYALIGGRLAHPDPPCLGITPEQIAAAARPSGNGKILP